MYFIFITEKHVWCLTFWGKKKVRKCSQPKHSITKCFLLCKKKEMKIRTCSDILVTFLLNYHTAYYWIVLCKGFGNLLICKGFVRIRSWRGDLPQIELNTQPSTINKGLGLLVAGFLQPGPQHDDDCANYGNPEKCPSRRCNINN